MDYELKSQESFNVKNESGTTILKIDSTGDGGVYIKGVGGYDGAAISSAKTLQDVVSISMTEITWSELKTLRDNSGLTPGMQYRITDYTCTTAQANTQSANHPFDIIVTADSENTLNENARAIQHSGDTYFANSNLAAWELKYSLDNDTTKFAWADSGSTGRGVIYWMKDEWNNECPYDFKNIKFSVRPAFGVSQYGAPSTYTKNGTVVNIDNVNYYGYTRTKKTSGPPPPPEQLYVTETVLQTSMSLYTITNNVATVYTTATVTSVTSESYDSYTFNCSLEEDASMSLTKNCYSNIIGKLINNDRQELNWIFFRSANGSVAFVCYGNTFKLNCRDIRFENYCYSNTFGDGCYSNRFKDGCYSNTFENYCSNNTFGKSFTNNLFGKQCSTNTFGDNCAYNSFGNSCPQNTFGNNCSQNAFVNNCINNTFGNNCNSNTLMDGCNHNIFGNNCSLNIFGADCGFNTFGNGCSSNTFENGCDSNTFGNTCASNTFGNNCNHIKFGTASTVKSYYTNIIIENGNSHIYIDVTSTTSLGSQYKNVKIAQGINNKTPYKTITDNNVNQTFQTVYQPTNSQIINI